MSAFIGSPARSHLWFAIGAGEVVDGAYAHYQRNEAKTLRKRLLAGPTVDIYVGAEKRHWSLHRNLLCHHSSWFESEFLGHEVPRKGEERHKLELGEDDPRGFELLVKWLYQSSLDGMEGMGDEEKYDYAVACHKLYLLCDKFDMVQLKNISMDLFRRGLNEAQLVPDPEEINDIYRASPPNSPFRRLMTKIAARQIMDPEVDKDAESYRKCFESNPDFAVEMVNAIRYASGGMLFEDPTRGDLCEYHDHSDGQNCHAKGKGKGSPRKKAQFSQEPEPQEPSVPQKPPRTPRKLRSPITPGSSPSNSQDGSPKHALANGTKESAGRRPEPKEFLNGSATSPGASPSSSQDGSPKRALANGARGLPGRSLEPKERPNGTGNDQTNGHADVDLKRSVTANTSSPRQLPKNRFNTIVRQLSGVKEGANGSADHESQTTASTNDPGKPAIRKQPRKISVAAKNTNGINGVNGHGANGTNGHL